MLSPKRVKFRKMHRGRMKGKAFKNNNLINGTLGIQALECSWVTATQIEAVRKTIARYTKRSGKIWIRIFPDKSVTERPAESRMGTGKGSVDHWISVVRPGTILFEIAGIDEAAAITALKIASYKLPLKTKIINKNYEF